MQFEYTTIFKKRLVRTAVSAGVLCVFGALLLICRYAPREAANAGSLRQAIAAGNVERVKGILVHTPPVERDPDLLWFAIDLGRAKEALLLIEAGFPVNQRNSDGLPAMEASIRKQSPEIVNALVQHGAALDVRWSSLGSSGAFMAPATARAEDTRVQQLIRLQKFQVTPAQYAALYGNAEIARLLVTADPKLGDIWVSSGVGDDVAVQAVLDRDASLLESDAAGTPLCYAARTGQTRLVSSLLKRGARLTAPSLWGSPLHCAALSGSDDSCAVLVDGGADVGALNVWQETPLHLAVRANATSVVKYLLEKGADPNASQCGHPPLEYATEGSIAELLRKAGARETTFTISRDNSMKRSH